MPENYEEIQVENIPSTIICSKATEDIKNFLEGIRKEQGLSYDLMCMILRDACSHFERQRANDYAKVGAFWLEDSNMYGTYKALFHDVLGVNVNVLNDPYESKAFDEYFQTGPCYPNEGYIVPWDTVIIKISEP